jgi:signal transduction histidine kinase
LFITAIVPLCNALTLSAFGTDRTCYKGRIKMLFDDRLGTVLRHRPGGVTAAKTQYRQLLDLLGTLPSEARGDAVDAAYLRLTELGEQIETADKLDMVCDPGLRLRSPRLVAVLAASDARLASATIHAARLSDREWLDLIPALPVPARQFLRRRDDLGPEARGLLDALGVHDQALPPAEPAVAEEERVPLAEVVTEPAPRTEGTQGIAALVKRIEAFRKARVPAQAANDGQAPRLPLGEDALPGAVREVRAFDFACDAEGRITWADPGVAPMTVGLSLTAGDDAEARALARAIRRLLPLRAARRQLSGAPAVVGNWQIDAMPWFDAAGGRLAGWRGRFRRLPEAALAAPVSAAAGEADRIRQLLHELKTPVNAIQGYAEAMQQGLFGPIGHEYRAMSADIASDAARILAGFEELERLARLDSGAMELEPGLCDLGDMAVATAARLRPHTFARRIFFDVQLGEGPLIVPIAPLEAERLLWRLLATLAGAATPGERLRLRLRRRGDQVRLRLQLPAALAARSDEELFRASTPAASGAQSLGNLSSGNFGGGFALRLAAAEARAGGGELVRRGDKLRLSLAGLTEPALVHSHGADTAGPRMAVPD